MNIANIDSIPTEIFVGAIILCLVFLPFLVSAFVSRRQKSRNKALARKKAQEQYTAIVMVAGKLSRELSALLESNEDPLDLIVHFFSLTSPVSDSTFMSPYELQPFISAKQNAILIRICSTLGNMGRSPFGMNRTDKEQRVTPDNIYLGNICGIWTHSVNFWKAERSKLTGAQENVYKTLQCQAREFMSSNAGALKNALTPVIA